MTKYIPHVSLSVSALMSTLLAVLGHAQADAVPVATWAASVGIPAVVGIVTTVQQMIQSKSVGLQQLIDLGTKIQNLETAVKNSGIKL